MFLPDVMRGEIERNLGVVPATVHNRQHPLPAGNPDRGRRVLWLGVLILAVLVTVPVATRRRVPRRLGLVLGGVVLGLVALFFDVFALLSTMPELTRNELLLVFLPTDLALTVLNGVWLRRYLAARLVGLGLVAALIVAGILLQPLWAPIALVGLTCGIVLGLERFPVAGRVTGPTEQALLPAGE
jgi:hypothetical protein